jgi:type II secretory pathway pseudopilin PulG
MKTAVGRTKARQIAGIAAILLAVSLSARAQTAETPTPPPQQPSETQQANPPQQPAASPGTAPATPPQPAYQPKFVGDPAHSESEAVALGYMRTVLRAQKEYKKKNDHYATSLAALVHTGSFTRRMAQTDRGDYTVGFRSNKNGFELTLTPKELSADRRSFYADEDGDIYADDQKAADEHSTKIARISMK